MKRRALMVASVVAVVGILGAGGAGVPGGLADKPPCVQWVGHWTQRAEPGFVIVRDEAAWRSLWAEHTGLDVKDGAMKRHAAPKVDFERWMVVGCFRAATINGDGEVARSVMEDGSVLRVRYVSSSFQTAGPGGGGVDVRPYGLWVVPATDKPVVVERGHITKDPREGVRWDEVWRSGAKN
jgi:hypothetical protein